MKFNLISTKSWMDNNASAQSGNLWMENIACQKTLKPLTELTSLIVYSMIFLVE